MNIFFVDHDPTLAAKALCDKHVVKMILESAQLLCTTHHLHPLWDLPEYFYKKTHVNHPCAIWTRTTTVNYSWLAIHAYDLCEEYTYRYNKIHKSSSIIEWCLDNMPDVPVGLMTKPALAMPDEYKCDDPVKSYRDYYWHVKRNTIKMVWTKRGKPYWWKN